MGPNGSGKSTLAQVLAGHPAYTVTGGEVLYEGEDLLDLSRRSGPGGACSWPSSTRWRSGRHQCLFPARRVTRSGRQRGSEEADPMDFLDVLEEKLKVVEWGPEIMQRFVNAGFSCEKKRNEILQMAVLEPRLAILDETDSGLDIDALRIVAAGQQAQAP